MMWLANWISCCLSWIDSQEFPKPVVQVARDTSSGPARITMTGATGRLFYTTNGTDPRMRGGGVSPAGLEYREPIPATTNTSVFARTRSDYGLWSAPVRLDLTPSYR